MIPQVDADGNLVGSDNGGSTAVINEVLKAENDLMDAVATGDEEVQDKVSDVREDAYGAVGDAAAAETQQASTTSTSGTGDSSQTSTPTSGSGGSNYNNDPVTVEEPNQQSESQPENDPGVTIEFPSLGPTDARPEQSGSSSGNMFAGIDSTMLLAGGGVLVGLLLLAGGGFGG